MILKETTIPQIFKNRTAELGEKAIVAYKKDGKYTDISWNEMSSMVKKLGCYLISIGVKKEDKVAIFSPNRYEWWVADLAILSIGAINVPIYATNSAEEAHYVIEHSESNVCLVGTEDHLERVLKVRKKLPMLKDIIMFDKPAKKRPGIITFQEACEKGDQYKNKSLFDQKVNEVKPKDVATIIYTSGTTGNPKGVMLTQSNFVSNVNQVMNDFSDTLSRDDVLLSFLPLSHSLERTSGYYMPMSFGGKVAFAEDFATIQQNLVEIKPTIIISVPRLYEKVHAGILSKLTTAPAIKKALVNWALRVAEKNLPYVCEAKERKGFFAFQFNLADKLVFSKLKAALGLENEICRFRRRAPLGIRRKVLPRHGHCDP
jgi:long-chain acyl-CoA synthetase